MHLIKLILKAGELVQLETSTLLDFTNNQIISNNQPNNNMKFLSIFDVVNIILPITDLYAVRNISNNTREYEQLQKICQTLKMSVLRFIDG
jgi:hypothetical protein